MSDELRERLSALVDGELADVDSVHVLDRIAREPALKAVWERYHLVSDVLRNHLPAVSSFDLVDKVRQAVEAEPVSIRPRRRFHTAVLKPVAGFALAASVAVVAVLGFRGMSGPDGTSAVETVAQTQAPVSGVGPTGLRWDVDRPDVEARLNAYMVNHSEHTVSTLRSMMPYARIIAYDAGR
jgi:sigma-E factor negative regulatory protein RseA